MKIEIGMSVNVEHRDGDMFNHDFTGKIVGIHLGKVDGPKFVSLEDQDGNVWDCDLDQLSSIDEFLV